MINVLYAVAVLGIMGLVFGLILAIASKIFEVKKDVRIEQISEILPGANCGGCGFAGCSAYADAVVNKGAPVNCCVAASAGVHEKIGEIMGKSAEETEKKVAAVMCSGGCNACKKFDKYEGIQDCVAATKVLGGNTICSYACLGFGTCVKACTFNAISIKDGKALVNSEKCTGCMACASVCPRKIIESVPYKSKVTVPCSSKDKGGDTRKACTVGCIGCKICEKNCEFDAIHVIDNCAYIDYSKCTQCGKCVLKCPRKIIFFNGANPAEEENKLAAESN